MLAHTTLKRLPFNPPRGNSSPSTNILVEIIAQATLPSLLFHPLSSGRSPQDDCFASPRLNLCLIRTTPGIDSVEA